MLRSSMLLSAHHPAFQLPFSPHTLTHNLDPKIEAKSTRTASPLLETAAERQPLPSALVPLLVVAQSRFRRLNLRRCVPPPRRGNQNKKFRFPVRAPKRGLILPSIVHRSPPSYPFPSPIDATTALAIAHAHCLSYPKLLIPRLPHWLLATIHASLRQARSPHWTHHSRRCHSLAAEV